MWKRYSPYGFSLLELSSANRKAFGQLKGRNKQTSLSRLFSLLIILVTRHCGSDGKAEFAAGLPSKMAI